MIQKIKTFRSGALSTISCLGFAALLVSTPAHAEVVCLKSTLRNGKIINTTRVVPDDSACPRGFKRLFSSTSITTLSPEADLTGPVGPQGPTGAQGPQGATGPQGSAGSGPTFQIVVGESANNSTSPKQASADCPDGTVFHSGWGSVDNGILSPVEGVAINFQVPNILGQGFIARAFEAIPTDANWLVKAWAVCRSAS